MAKRKGANGRKRSFERAGKRLPWGRVTTVVAVIFAIAVAVAALSLRTGNVRCASFTGRFFRPRSSIVTAMTVVGGDHVTAGQIMGRLGIRLPMHFSPMKEKFEREIGRLSPWIAEATLRGPHEGVVNVVITERKPVAIAARATICLVDTAGAYIPFDPRCARYLPFVSGLRDSPGTEPRYLINADRVRLNRFLSGLAAFDPQIASCVTQVHFGSDGMAELWLEGSPTKIVLDVNNLTNGLERLVELLPSVRSDSGVPSRIDLSCRNLAFVTIRGAVGDGAGKTRQKG